MEYCFLTLSVHVYYHSQHIISTWRHHTSYFQEEEVWCCHVIGPTLQKTTFSAHRFFSYSFTASDGSEGTTAGRVVSPRSIMVHHGFRSQEARRARKQKYRLRQTSHSSLLVTRQGHISRKLNQAFLLVDSFNFNFFIVDERWDIYIYQYVNNFIII